MFAVFKFKPGTHVTLVNRDHLRSEWTQENVGFIRGGITLIEATEKPRDMLDMEYPSTAYGIVAKRPIIGSEAPSYLGTALHHIFDCSQLLGATHWPVIEGAFTFHHRDGVWAVVRMPDQQPNALVFAGRSLNLAYTGAWTPSFEGLAEVVIIPKHNEFPGHDDHDLIFKEEELRGLGVPIKDEHGKPLFVEA